MSLRELWDRFDRGDTLTTKALLPLLKQLGGA
jgi:hypothetical protein